MRWIRLPSGLFCFVDVLVGKPVSTPDRVRGMLFRDMHERSGAADHHWPMHSASPGPGEPVQIAASLSAIRVI
jgi:hypothetical protein